jgi:hypothetical protein
VAYDKGDLVRCRGTFRDPETGDALVDPSTVTFKVKDPSDTLIEYVYGVDAQLVKEAVGRYRVDVDASAAGTWVYRFESTGTYQAADEGKFTVEASGF